MKTISEKKAKLSKEELEEIKTKSLVQGFLMNDEVEKLLNYIECLISEKNRLLRSLD